ncbi:pectinesterase-like [Neltuma alba]|uniref:pectinesterase-like n=1 Tax=Neltuma alba TaxID=207710 RepID=UPI0010A5A101|nr:pectinesterase-like [Prosopis alba]
MARSLLILFLSFFLFACLLPTATSRLRRSKQSLSQNIQWWCDRTPHPEQCEFYMMSRTHRHGHRLKHKSKFRVNLIQLALDQAKHMQYETRENAQNCEAEKLKVVLDDCLKLYDNAIFHLNRTFQGLGSKRGRRPGCSNLDAQTWLSTALTNIQTCKNGAKDLKLTVPQFTESNTVCYNVSKMISNSLAINAAFLTRSEREELKNGNNNGGFGQDDDEKNGFPRWFSRKERKLVTVSASKIKANLVVAKDGSGHFRTVQAAINAAAKRKYKTRFVIRVKKGVYNENIEVDKSNDNIMLIGDGLRDTVITSSKSTSDGLTTYSTATAGIDGLHFIARDISFRNSAGPRKGQAVALRSASDLSVFYRCGIIGYQDTVMAHAQRQFYKQCYIFGTVDIVFGNAAAVFQNCIILVRRPLSGQANMITAQGRGDPFQNTGTSIHSCVIKAAPDLKPVIRSVSTYLGRPWQEYARVVVMRSRIDSLVSPLGWSKWGNTNFALNTLYFGEYKNFGSGSSTKNRVKWKGYHVIASSAEASKFTVNGLIAGGTWLPSTGVPFTSGL